MQFFFLNWEFSELSLLVIAAGSKDCHLWMSTCECDLWIEIQEWESVLRIVPIEFWSSCFSTVIISLSIYFHSASSAIRALLKSLSTSVCKPMFFFGWIIWIMSGLKCIKQKYVAILETFFYRYKLHLEMIRIRMRRTFIIIIIKSVMQ